MEKGGSGSRFLREKEQPVAAEAGNIHRSSEIVADLALRASEGDEAAFDRLVFLYSNIADSLVEKYSGKAQFTDDLKQQALTALIEALRELLEEDLSELSKKEIGREIYSKVYSKIQSHLEKYSEKDPEINEDYYKKIAEKGNERRDYYKGLEALRKEQQEISKKLNELHSQIVSKDSLNLRGEPTEELLLLQQDLKSSLEIDRYVDLMEDTDRLLRELWEKQDRLKKMEEESGKGFFEKRRLLAELKHDVDEAKHRLQQARENKQEIKKRIEERWGEKYGRFVFSGRAYVSHLVQNLDLIVPLLKEIDSLSEREVETTKRISELDSRTRNSFPRGIDRNIAQGELYKELAKAPLRVDGPDVLLHDLGFEGQYVNKLLLEEMLNRVKDILTEREYEVIRLYYGLKGEKEHTLREISEIFGITTSRIGEIRSKAFCKLRKPLRGAYNDYLDN